MTKQKLLIFEGCDKVGKTTLYQLYRRATKYGPLVIDRFLGSNEVYNQFYERKDEVDYRAEEAKLEEQFDVYLVVLRGEIDNLKARILTEETDNKAKMIALENFISMRELFDRYFVETGFKNKLVINTTLNDQATCLERILKFTCEGGY